MLALGSVKETSKRGKASSITGRDLFSFGYYIQDYGVLLYSPSLFPLQNRIFRYLS